MTVKCPFHPTYKAIRAPKADCWFCRRLWELVEAIRTMEPQ